MHKQRKDELHPDCNSIATLRESPKCIISDYFVRFQTETRKCPVIVHCGLQFEISESPPVTRRGLHLQATISDLLEHIATLAVTFRESHRDSQQKQSAIDYFPMRLSKRKQILLK